MDDKVEGLRIEGGGYRIEHLLAAGEHLGRAVVFGGVGVVVGVGEEGEADGHGSGSLYGESFLVYTARCCARWRCAPFSTR